MKIRDITATVVSVPLTAPLRWSMGIETATTRAIIRVETEDGIVGVGETYGSAHTEAEVAFAAQYLRGVHVMETGVLHHRLGVFRIGYETSVPVPLRAGIEMACLDAAGKALGVSVSTLLGGAVRARVDVAAYLFYRHANEQGVGGEHTSTQIVERAKALVAEYGFHAIKLKGGVFPPRHEFEAVLALREAFPDAPLRWDPNAAWSVSTSLRVMKWLDDSEVDLEYLEDPTVELQGMAEVRAKTTTPLATNMCLVEFNQLAPGIRLGAVDIILSDVHFWGGFWPNQRMMAVCEAFGLGVGMHSDRELGVSTAAMLHLAAVSPLLNHAIDSHYPEQAGDILTAPLSIEDGSLAVPTGPGLGVELDLDEVERWHQAFLKEGTANEFYDESRPHWVPSLPQF